MNIGDPNIEEHSCDTLPVLPTVIYTVTQNVTGILVLLSQTREYKTTANQRRASLVTLNAPGEVSNKTELLFWQAESATVSF